MNLRWAEKLLQYNVHASHHFGHEEVFAGFIKRAFLALLPSLLSRETEPWRGRACWGGVASGGRRECGSFRDGGGSECARE